MFPFYKDYVWKGGKPCGVQKVEEPAAGEAVYRIVSDPYRKWISLEAYVGKTFERMVYDSRFLDFRKLTAAHQVGWRRESVGESEAWIFNEDDRLILRERCIVVDGKCLQVLVYTPYDTLICCYDLSQEAVLGQVPLYDSNQHLVQ